MQVRVLGCSGGISQGLRTTSLLVDEDLLIDAGTGVGDLSVAEMQKIRHVFLTHSHLDHVLGVPLLVDTLFNSLHHPLLVHGLPATLEALRRHVFNWSIWPDFSVLPSARGAVMSYVDLEPCEPIAVGDRRLTLCAVSHTVPAGAYLVESDRACFCFSGDTGSNDTLWRMLNERPGLDLLIVECGMPDRQAELAEAAKHYCPRTLAADLVKLHHEPQVAISHLKAGSEEETFAELCAQIPRRLTRLRGGEVFRL